MKGLKVLRFVVAFVLVSMGCWACGGDENGKNIPDVSHIPVQISVQRFDKDLFALDTAQLAAGIEALGKKYPEMLGLFAGNVIHDQSNPAETPEQALSAFLRSPEVRRLYDTCQVLYADLGWLEKDLARMFKFYKYYFPEKPVPQVFAMVSEFATDAFTAGDELCGIGLDLYLGKDFPGYNPEIFPDYIRRQFYPEYMPVRLAKSLAQNLAGDPPGKRLLDQMLHHGKLLYITDCLLPETPDSLKMGYTAEQMAGCLNNEAEVWARLLDQKLLYSTDFNKWRKLVTPSPNAPVVFTEAPGEVGNWLGWQIVKSFMKRQPKTTMADLLAMRDSQKFLELAKYKPKR